LSSFKEVIRSVGISLSLNPVAVIRKIRPGG
jgi:hypothetical protein